MKITSTFLFLLLLSFSLFAQNPEWVNYTNCDAITSIKLEGEHAWLGTDMGLIQLNQNTNEVVYYDKNNSRMPENYVYSLVIDQTGNKWIGTKKGLAEFDGTNWTIYDSTDSHIGSNFIYSLAIDGSGNKWIGTWGGGLAKFDGTNWTVYDTSNSGLADNYIRSISIDGNGNKWIGTNSGLAEFDGINWTFYNNSNFALPNNFINAIAIDRSGNKWIGTWDGGLAKFDGQILDSL